MSAVAHLRMKRTARAVALGLAITAAAMVASMATLVDACRYVRPGDEA